MAINLTLVGQMITFALFVAITLKWIWPLFKKVLDERAHKIAEGLAAAQQGHQALEKAQRESEILIQSAKEKAARTIEESKIMGQSIIATAQQQASQEAERILARARQDIEQEELLAREKLRQEVVTLAVAIAQKILQREVASQDNEKAFDRLMAGL